VAIQSSRISGNFAERDGGGVSNVQYGILTIQESTISGNTAVNNGGGLSSAGRIYTYDTDTYSADVRVERSTFSGNTAKVGGGIFHSGVGLTIDTSTIAKNKATTFGGGLRVTGGEVEILNSTIASNSATTSGGGLSIAAAWFAPLARSLRRTQRRRATT
jgi:hypothetical protein